MKKHLALGIFLLGTALAHGGHVELQSAALKKVTGGYVLVGSIQYHEKELVVLSSAVVAGQTGVLQAKTSKGYQRISRLPINMGTTAFGTSSNYRIFFKSVPQNKKLYLTLLMSGNVLGQEIKISK
ncbi:hypothetical protein [Deinococcus misasensis]|uniref:hypothetical protein n=1 Tax=Deinococcus misasensis TaxID=392413 RepID=UPI0005511D07|nr:hypothetical protein [Deinococcus misasensis]